MIIFKSTKYYLFFWIGLLLFFLDRFHIKDYTFHYPSHNWFLFFSSIFFILAVFYYTKILDNSRLKKLSLLWFTLNLCLILLASFFSLLKLKILITGRVYFYIIILENALLFLSLLYYKALLSFIVENKKQTFFYFLLSIPYLLMVIVFEGGYIYWDTAYQVMQGLGYKKITTYNPPFNAFIFRFFNTDKIYLPAYIQALVLWYSVYLFSQLFKKKYLQYLIFIFILYNPAIYKVLFMAGIKGVFSAVFVLLFISSLLFFFHKSPTRKYLIISFIGLCIATYSRQNTITMTVVLLVPFTMMLLSYLKHSITFKKMLIFFTIEFLFMLFPLIFIFNNPLWTVQESAFRWTMGSDIAYTACKKGKYEILEGQISYERFLKICTYGKDPKNPEYSTQKSVLQQHPTAFIQYSDWNVDIDAFNLWIHTIYHYYPSVLELHYYTFIDILKFPMYGGRNIVSEYDLLFKDYIYFKRKLVDTTLGKNLRFLIEVYNDITYKPFFILQILLLITSFVWNRFRLFPIMDKDNYRMPMVYYMSISCLTLLLGLVLTVPYAHDVPRYLLSGIQMTVFLSAVFIWECIETYKNYKLRGESKSI